MTAVAEVLHVDRAELERILIEIDSVSSLEILLHSRNTTIVSEKLDAILTALEEATGLADDDPAGLLHTKAWARGEEMFRDWAAQQIKGGRDAR